MKNIKLKSLSISNFRGVSKMEIDFSDVTIIKGDNGTGKSSVKNAFIWLLTNSDEYDRLNYKLFDEKVVQTKENSKTLDVAAKLDIDGIEYEIRKTASIGWTRKRERTEYERKGSDNYSFYVDGVERTATDYKNFIEETICPIEKLKFILNTNYPLLLDWKELRKHFEELVGTISEKDFVNDYSNIADLLVKYKNNVDDIKAYLRPRINELAKKVGKGETKGELDIQIDTLTESLPDISGLEDIKSEIEDAEKQIKQIDEQISGSSEGIKPLIEKRNNEVNEISRLKSEYAKEETAYNEQFDSKVRKLQSHINEVKDENYAIKRRNEDLNREHELIVSKIGEKRERVRELEVRREQLLEKNRICKAREFDGFNCSYCGQPLPQDKLDEAKTKFEMEKEKEHGNIVADGTYVKNQIDSLNSEIKTLEDKLNESFQPVELKSTEDLEAELSDFKTNFTSFEQTIKGAEMLAEIEEKMANMTTIPKVDNSALANMKSELIKEIKENSAKLGLKDSYDKQMEHIKRLQKELKDSACELAALEGKRDSVEQYDREKAGIIYNRVNKDFNYVKVEMTELNKSGTYVDTCRILDKNGVDMRVTNTASKVLCGADIAMSFARKLGLNMPLILDDMEKVNKNNIPNVDCQLVMLKFDYCDFTIENE